MGDLAEWIGEEYDINVLNIWLDYITPAGELRPRLEIVLESRADEELFRKGKSYNYDEGKQKRIAEKFIELNSMKKKGFFCKKEKQIENVERMLVIFSAFAPIAQSDANNKITSEEVERLRDKYLEFNVWEISKFFGSINLFFYTDEQVDEFKESELISAIEKEYLLILERHDVFGYYKKYGFRMNLDSKENFDNNYASNWYYYYK